MDVGFAPQMSHLLARGSVEQEEQWLHRSKVLQSVGSFNTRMGKSISPQQAQYEVSIATQWLHRSKVLHTAGSLDTRMCKRNSPHLSQYEVSIAARMGVVTKRMVLMAALLYLLLLHLLALLLATIVNVVVNVIVQRRQTVVVFAVAAFDICVAAAVVAV